MKKIVGIILILAVLILGGYYLMGLITEHTLKKNITMLDESNELHLTIKHYDRQWFASKAILNLQLHIPPRQVQSGKDGQNITIPAQDYNILMPLDIHHGPIIFSDSKVRFGLGAASSHVVLPKEVSEEFVRLYAVDSSKPEANLSLFVNYLNKTSLKVDVPAFKLIGKDGGQQFKWQGMRNDIHLSADYSHIDGNMDLSGLLVTKDQVNLLVTHVNSDYDLHQTDMGLFLGRADLDIASVAITKAEDKLFDIDQVKAHSIADVLGGLFQSQAQLSFNKLQSNGQIYGPAVLDIAVKNVDAKVLMQVNDQLNKMQQGSELERQQALILLLPELPKLLNKGAEFTISEFNMTLPDGAVHLNMLLTFSNEEIRNPVDIVQKMKGKASLEVSKALAQKVMETSVYQKLMKQSALQQAMVQQMKAKAQEDKSAFSPSLPVAQNTIPSKGSKSLSASPINAQAAQVNAPPSSDDGVLEQARALAIEKIAAMVKSGALVVQGESYLIELHLEQGQLFVNGKPFTSAMVPKGFVS